MPDLAISVSCPPVANAITDALLCWACSKYELKSELLKGGHTRPTTLPPNFSTALAPSRSRACPNAKSEAIKNQVLASGPTIVRAVLFAAA